MEKRQLYFLGFLFSLVLSSCSSEEWALSDSFEQIDLVQSEIWKQSGGGSIVVDRAHVYSGTQSLRFISGEGYSERAFLSLDHIFPVKDNSFGGSYMLFIEEVSPDGIHWTMLEATGQLDNYNSRAEVRYGGQHAQRLMANYDTPSETVDSDCWQHSTTVLPNQQWVEIAWYFDGLEDTMHFWLDGEKIEDLTMIKMGEGCLENDLEGNWFFPTFDTFTVGWVDYQKNGGQRTLWIDDLHLHPEPPYEIKKE